MQGNQKGKPRCSQKQILPPVPLCVMQTSHGRAGIKLARQSADFLEKGDCSVVTAACSKSV
jgi:hypothetical protein